MASIGDWFARYLDTFGSCVRGETAVADLLRYYAVPLVITTDDGLTSIVTADDVSATMLGQVNGLRAGGFHHTEVMHAESIPINAVSALYRCTLSRQRRDGTEIDRPTITYVLTGAPPALSISLIAVHGDR